MLHIQDLIPEICLFPAECTHTSLLFALCDGGGLVGDLCTKCVSRGENTRLRRWHVHSNALMDNNGLKSASKRPCSHPLYSTMGKKCVCGGGGGNCVHVLFLKNNYVHHDFRHGQNMNEYWVHAGLKAKYVALKTWCQLISIGLYQGHLGLYPKQRTTRDS